MWQQANLAGQPDDFSACPCWCNMQLHRARGGLCARVTGALVIKGWGRLEHSCSAHETAVPVLRAHLLFSNILKTR